MNESMQELQRAIQRARQGGPVKAIVYAICQEPTCAGQEFQQTVREGKSRRSYQAPLRCPRCGKEAVFEELQE
jgi:hypothetical protein